MNTRAMVTASVLMPELMTRADLDDRVVGQPGVTQRRPGAGGLHVGVHEGGVVGAGVGHADGPPEAVEELRLEPERSATSAAV